MRMRQLTIETNLESHFPNVHPTSNRWLREARDNSTTFWEAEQDDKFYLLIDSRESTQFWHKVQSLPEPLQYLLHSVDVWEFDSSEERETQIQQIRRGDYNR
jgi:hypothetical protein